jgi:hypothetical protein
MDDASSSALSRRRLLGRGALGLGALGLGALALPGLAGCSARQAAADPLGPKAPMIPARAKRVIYLHMAGSPSHLDLFEHKPELAKLTGQPCPESLLKGKRFAFIKGVPKMLGSPFRFGQHGQSGQWLSELLPNFATVIDDVAVIRSVNTDQFNHAPAQLFMHTGQPRLGNPSLGAWVTHGLGSVNRDLPGFVVLSSGGKTPDAGKSVWGSGFLPSVHQGVQCRAVGDPVLYLGDPPGLGRELRRGMLDQVQALNRLQHEAVGDPETLTRSAQYELAYRMQASVPAVMDIAKEPQHILELYGAKPGHVAPTDAMGDPRAHYRGDDPTFANNCLLARRLVEAGVRFVQLYDWGWDHHGASPGESIDETLPIKCQQIDRALAGLITDLKQRGMLDDTLVIWGGEFGRTPMMQNDVRDTLVKGFIGRDHHPYANTMWLAGGGIKGGVAHGETDEIGYYIIRDPVSIRDLQATILNQLGLDPYRFSYRYQGLDQRLIGPSDEGKVLKALLA